MTRRHTVHTLSSILLSSEISQDGRGEEEAGGRRGGIRVERRGETQGSKREEREGERERREGMGEEEACRGEERKR